ncbi:PHD finger protein 3 isoform X1 [Lepisosteus oculatus]|uniref:PHD finger protein 3 isoform X1 n=3 Tax=Lepisosteus oculatus TaxID=7918 RepID=UPI0035F504BC
MDIVDTFNHLIPSDQLDDTLLLGPNLDSEVSDEFGTGHNLLEDSLKNMLSDKDPMLGSASTQFHLLDNDDANFQIADSTAVGLDMMSEGGIKASGHGATEDDLMLLNKNQRGRAKPALGSPRKSPRLMAQEPVRSLRQSTLARRSGPTDTSAVKKSPAKSGQGRRGGSKQLQEQPQEHAGADMGSEEEKEKAELARCSGSSGEPKLPSSAVATAETSAVTAEGDASSSSETGEPAEPPQDSSAGDTDGAQPLKDAEETLCQITSAESGEQDKPRAAPGCGRESGAGFSAAPENVASEADIGVASELGPCVNPNEVQEGPHVLVSTSKVADWAPRDSGGAKRAETEPKNKDQIAQQRLEASSGRKIQQRRAQDGSEAPHLAEPTKAMGPSAPKSKIGQQPLRKWDQKVAVRRQLKSKQVRSVMEQRKQLLPNVQGERIRPEVVPQKKTRSDFQNFLGLKRKQSLTAGKGKVDELKRNFPPKIQKTQHNQDVKTGNVHIPGPQKPAPLFSKSSKSPEVVRSSTNRASSSRGGQEKPKSQHAGMQAGVGKPFHSQVGLKPQNPHIVVGNISSYVPVDGFDDDDRDKPKVKRAEKGLHRQRRSSRSLSLDEPPLFIPDNAPAVKKEGPEDDSTDSEALWDPSKHCGLCKKPHNNRFMVGCGRCDDWFHGECVGLDLAKAQQMEQEDQEYVCLKCCAEEDRKAQGGEQQRPPEGQLQESRPAARAERQGHTLPLPAPLSAPAGGHPHSELQDAASPPDDRKHRVRIFRKDSVERRQSEQKDVEHKRLHSSLDHKPGQAIGVKQGDSRTHVDTVQKSGMHEKLDMKKAKVEKVPVTSPTASKKPSVEQIRKNVRDSLKDILVKRLSESDMKVSAERAARVALKTEKELFAFFRDTDSKYKSKYRSLMFNLKDAKNNVLFKRVLKGEITPDHLIRMSPEELASKELAAWRQRENRHTIEMIEKEQREAERRPITKITHKGEIEIENQEPVKEPEAMEVEPEPVPKPAEEPVDVPEEEESEISKDTTSQHKRHLFDLNCKICTGRMAPPVEDASTKVVKVATTVIRRQSSAEGETPVETTTSAQPDTLAFGDLEENKSLTSRVSFSSEGRSEAPSSGEDEATFLSRLESLWKGFINMPSVAKFVTKAYPVSGILDHLTEDLPDSIQVGGRISPQTVWDYVEKIRASGTKEVCLIRFSPGTEEDEISYTLLYAYFSSRKRYGVVANNMKQVKDMYLIPLGSSEKIPHHLVPFDGPGLEAKRPNLLLGLIIRQRVKRDFGVVLPVDVSESSSSRFLPEKRTKVDLPNESEDGPDEQNDFFNPLKVVAPKHLGKAQQSGQDEAEDEKQQHEEAPIVVESNVQEPPKPLRFLPGVLVGWDNQPSTLDLASKPLPMDIIQSLLGTTEKAPEKETTGDGVSSENIASKNPSSNGPKLDRFIVKKKEAKIVTIEQQSNPNDKCTANDSSGVEPSSGPSPVSLKDKPPDVSTEAFLANLPTAQAGKEEDTLSENKVENKVFAQKEELHKAQLKSEGSSATEKIGNISSVSPAVSSASAEEQQPTVSKSSVFSGSVKDPRQTVGRILKSSPAPYLSQKQSFNDDDGHRNAQEKEVSFKAENVHSGSIGNPIPREHTPVFNVPVLNTDIQCSSARAVGTPQGYSYQQALTRQEEVQNISTAPSFAKGADLNMPVQGHPQGPPVGVFPQGGPAPPPSSFPPLHASGPEFQYHSIPAPGFPGQNNSVPQFQPQLQPMPPNFSFPRAAPPMFHQPEPEGPSHGASWPRAGPPLPGFPPRHLLPGPAPPYEPARYVGSGKPLPSKEDKGPERRYSDHWDRQPHYSDDAYKRDHGSQQGRQRFYSESHHERKGREHERDRGKHWEHHSEQCGHRERSHSREEKSREHHRSHEERHRDRHPSHGAEHGRAERHRDRQQSGERGGRHDADREKNRERDRHKKDYECEKGVKSPKEKSKDDKHL